MKALVSECFERGTLTHTQCSAGVTAYQICYGKMISFNALDQGRRMGIEI